jgi:transcriptional regulator with PAS, ATPase and Fis domain
MEFLTMQQYQKKIKEIQSILQKNQKGMTVSDIANEMNINRNSVAKYLEIMRISGHVEMITFGPAKVFFPTRRIPITSLFNHISDYIIIIDDHLRIIHINDTFLKYLQETKDRFIGKPLPKTPLFFMDTATSLSINEAIDGKGPIQQMDYFHEKEGLYFKIKIIPIKFDDGANGASLIIKNITHQKRIQNLLKEWSKPHIISSKQR